MMKQNLKLAPIYSWLQTFFLFFFEGSRCSTELCLKEKVTTAFWLHFFLAIFKMMKQNLKLAPIYSWLQTFFFFEGSRRSTELCLKEKVTTAFWLHFFLAIFKMMKQNLKLAPIYSWLQTFFFFFEGSRCSTELCMKEKVTTAFWLHAFHAIFKI